jgi:hypothetical protein
MGLFDGALQGLAGGLVSGVASLIGGNQQNQAANDRMNAANEFSAQQFATRYQTTVKDLEAAGLNPMLAYGATPTAPSAATPAPVQNALGNAVESFNRTRATSAQAALQNEQLKQVDSQTQLNTAQAAKAVEEAKVAQEQAENLRVDRQKRTAEIPQVVASTKAYEGQATASAAQAAQSYKTIESLNAQISKLQEEAKLIKQTGDKSLPESEFARKYPTTYLIIDKLLPSISGTLRSIPK